MSQKSNGTKRVSNRRGKWGMVYSIRDSTKGKGWCEYIVTCDSESDAWPAKFDYQRRIDAGEFATKGLTFGEAAYHWLGYKNLKPLTHLAYEQLIRNVLTKYLVKPLHDVAQDRK